jgi:hypothetical protein
MASNLKRAIFDAVDSRISQYGFTLKRSKERFERKRDGIRDLFQLVCPNDIPGYRIHPDVGMRFEIVEEIFHKTSGWNPKYQKDTPTIGAGVGHIIADDNRKCEFRLKTEEDVPPVADKLADVFRNFALPYYEKFSSLQAIDAEFNNSPTERTRNRSGGWLRCSTGIIVARLVGRPDYDELAKIYTRVMEQVDGGFYLKTFCALLESLQSIEPLINGQESQVL